MPGTRPFLLALAIISIALACTCRDKGPEAAYCKAEFVSKVKIDQVYALAKQNHTYEMLYTVRHLTTIKASCFSVHGQRPANAHLPEEIRTPAHETMCGVVGLKAGQEVLLAGTMTACGFLRVDSCNQIPANFDTNKFKTIDCSRLVVI